MALEGSFIFYENGARAIQIGDGNPGTFSWIFPSDTILTADPASVADQTTLLTTAVRKCPSPPDLHTVSRNRSPDFSQHSSSVYN